MLKDVIGKRSETIKNTIERGAVKKFAEAIGDISSIYYDEEAGKNSRFKRNIAPPTFPVTFEFGAVADLTLPSKGLIHGEQSFHYKRPLFVGEDVYCFTEVKDYYEKTGSFGNMGFLVLTRHGLDRNDELIFTEERVIIINEEVRKGMLV
ncbi:MaoC family dehydratase N-terminal domain-containing protein [Sporosarcina pasteurii]|uniref:(3R)-hydroxyacyl-ACP dehydratase subunit HadA n=1 Tax=Sporosarcina pasteurii TaxID=1474 RepID=A0A380C1T5_SPOPA|nr:MaoC family dehydratase N-terminal domain-containing protein [Sporosarcina pasteurii]MDS9471584.1 MaoC family dehydratase N-terminal domain-containing protein [Sporosarcina pasteurii]QBQ04801.1 MaoC family dehydratase [Sporosarcina pasteurii]SUJ11205.1 (3R)-hydroxyacyl-ACP dehydratase subunit HadA [Sporosarcina pasteurii]